MQRELEAYLWDILEAIDEIHEFCDGLDFSAYLQNKMVRKAVERNFEIIGESLKRCESLFPGSTISLRKRFGLYLRDRLAHAYFRTNQQIVWETITEDIAPLRRGVRLLVKTDSPPIGEDPFSNP